MQSLTPMPSERKIWRRGEDLNPRGTFWAPIRFRVGRLQPGSATPPHQYRQQFIAYLTVRAECLQLRSLSLVEIPQRSRCSGRPWRAPVRFSRRLLPSVPGRQVRVPLNHAQRSPAAQRLDRSQVYRSSDETRSERVARSACYVTPSIRPASSSWATAQRVARTVRDRRESRGRPVPPPASLPGCVRRASLELPERAGGVGEIAGVQHLDARNVITVEGRRAV